MKKFKIKTSVKERCTSAFAKEKMTDYVDNFVELVETKGWKLLIYGSLPFLYLFPWLTLTVITSYFAFLLGIFVKESTLDHYGGVGLINRHFENRIGTKYDSRDFSEQLPNSDNQTLQFSAELEETLDMLVSYIVRDFITSWFEKLNLSGSSEFPDAVKASLKQAFMSFGKSISAINPTELMLAIMRQLILHVKEFREFDLTGLDMKDYLKANPDSKFQRFSTRSQVIDHLRNNAMKLSIHLLPRADRNSAVVFGITREILATTVLLPVLDKITAPDYINSAAIQVLGMQKDDGAEAPMKTDLNGDKSSDKYLLRSVKLEILIKQKEDRIKFLDSSLESVKVEDISQYVEEKLKIQGQLEELLEFESQEYDSPTLERLWDVSNAVVFVQAQKVDENISSILNGLGLSGYSGTTFDIHVTTPKGKTWKIVKTLKQIYSMQKKLEIELPRLRNSCPEFVNEVASSFPGFERKLTSEELGNHASELMIYFAVLLKDHVASLCVSLVQFFQPSLAKEDHEVTEISLTGSVNYLLQMGAASNTDIHQVLSTAGNSTLAMMKKASSDKVDTKFKTEFDPATTSLENNILEMESKCVTDISQQDLDIILDVAFTAIEELFSLSEGDQWLRQQSLHLIKVILKRTFARSLSNFLASKVSALSSQAMVDKTLRTLTDKLWPEGRKWGSEEPPEVKNQHEIDRTTHRLYCLLLGSEGIKKSQEFEGVYSNIQTALGTENAKKGFIRGFHLIQQQQLTAGLACEVLEIIVSMVTHQ